MNNKLWPKKKISWLFDVIGSGTTPPASNEMYYNSPDIAWLNTGDLKDSYIEKTSKYVSQQALGEFSSLTVFPKDSLVMAMYGATIGKLGITKYETTTNQACCVLSKPREVITKFIFYWLMGHRAKIINLSQGGGQPNISQGIIRDIRIAVPPVEMQSIIVTFINKKFEETNELIDKKEKMINLLEQQRQSIITEAVTKGLNPNVKMKDSGVEWIGEIPEHWEFSKVGYLGRLQNGISKSSDEFGFGTPFISYGDVYKNEILPKVASGLVNATEGDKKIYSVEYGDVFFTRTSETIEEIGIASTCFETIDEATFAGFLIRLRPITNRLSPRFARFYFRSALGKRYFVKEMNLVTRASLSQGLLRNFTVLLPSLKEQEEIASCLEQKTVAIEKSIKHINNQIEKLKEYRQSLIYEAVTGKIDVRDMELD